jgi:hypothetical protein
MLHIDRVFTRAVVHGVVLHGVAIWTFLDALLLTNHVLVTEWAERIPIFHINLVKIGQWDMRSVCRLDHHIWRVTLMLARVIDCLSINQSFILSNLQITICLFEKPCFGSERFIISAADTCVLESCLVPLMEVLSFIHFFGDGLSPFNCVIKVTDIGE